MASWTHDYTIAWICALPLETAVASVMLDKTHNPLPKLPTDSNAYRFGELNGHYIVIASLPSSVYEKASAASVVSRMRLTFPQLQYGLMVGIGGGVPSKNHDIRLGDVVVSKPVGKYSGVIQYDYGKAVQGAVQRRRWREEIADMRQNQLNAEILDWLSTTDFATQVQDLLNRRVGETGKWLVDSPIFKQWDEGDEPQIMLCQGIPGSGKTVMASIVCHYLQDRYGDDEVGFACFFCDFRRHNEKDISKFLLSLLCQLVQQQGFIPESIENWYAKFKKRRSLPLLREIEQVLHTVCRQFERLYVVVDALDECQGEDRTYDEEIFEALRTLQTETGARVFLTSRVIPVIKETFQGSLLLQIHAHEEDLRLFVKSRLSRSGLKRFRNLFDSIITEVVKAAEEMFLLAELHLKMLESKITLGSIEDSLQSLPRGPAGLHATYDQAMKRIGMDHVVNDGEKYARRAIEWVVYARRPLSRNEFLHAISVKEGTNDLDERYIPDLETILSFCGGLLTVDIESDIIRLIHYTTQEYFDQTGVNWFPSGLRNVAQTCITYLSFDTFHAGPCPSDSGYEARLQTKPLYGYCSQNWGHHVFLVLPELANTVKVFLASSAKVSSCAQPLMALGTFPDYSQQAPRELDGLHLAAFFGLKDLVEILLKDGYDASVKDSFGQTPLMWAAENGHESVVVLLLKTGVDINYRDKKYQTALHVAIWGLHIEIVRTLLRWNANTQIQDDQERGAFGVAAEVGSKEILRLLLQSTCPTISDGGCGDGRLDLEKLLTGTMKRGWRGEFGVAVSTGRAVEVKTLLDADPGLGKDRLQRMLNRAAHNLHESVLRVLLDAGADANGVDDEGKRALQLAVSQGDSHKRKLRSIISLLTTSGADIRARDSDGRSLFHHAAITGCLRALEYLVGIAQIGVDEPDSWGMTPIMLAAAMGQANVVRFLIQDHEADPNQRDHEGRTTLLCAIFGGIPSTRVLFKKAVKYFSACLYDNVCEIFSVLTKSSGIDINARDNYGATALNLAVQRNLHESEPLLIGLLLEAGATVDSNSLGMAVKTGNANLVHQLLQYGALPDMEDALEIARTKLFPEVATVLLNYVAKPPWFDNWMATAQLHAAVQEGDARMVESLISRGADVVAASNAHNLLSLAIEGGHAEVFRILARNGGLDIQLKKRSVVYRRASLARSPDFLRIIAGSYSTSDSQSENCPLYSPCLVCVVVESKSVERLQLLVNGGVDLNGSGGCSPIVLAIEKTELAILEYLIKHGADANYRNGAALHRPWHDKGAGRLLVEAGVDIESRHEEGWTPLGSALGWSLPKQVQALLELGADPHNVRLDSIERWGGPKDKFIAGMRLVRNARRVKR
ncbi:hypothetical protein FE257_003917 [Aspergillus nanangensis]|uniref:Uncharacterized protein n=1 Tax=Aspergillus nanangensis TaxID=2582783 RepID=A0AAD4CRK9_ASPNN|nr:hypothetical protein FE257_003917 [Aspergillus nanangensis]